MRPIVALLLVVLAGCGGPAAVTEGGPCTRAVTTMLDRLDAPDSPALSDPPLDIDTCTVQDRLAAGALLDDELGRQLQRFASEGSQPLGQDRAMLNLIAIFAAGMTPPPTFTPPEGWPTTFPVHPRARLLAHEHRGDGTLHAHWTIPAEDPGRVIAFYEDHLQQGVPGRWDYHSAHIEQTGDGDQARHDNTYQITGEGYRGTLQIDGPDDAGEIDVRAVLHPE